MKYIVEDIGCFESKDGHWELIRQYDDSKNDILGEPLDKYKLLHVVGDDYSDLDTEIIISGDKLKDLIGFLKQFKI